MKREGRTVVAERLGALGRRYGLDPRQAGLLDRFLSLLAEDPRAPTAVRDPIEAVDVHLADSLAALPFLDAALERGVPRVADLGSGAGLPGIPLAVARPAVRFDLVDATQRRCDFLTRAAEDLGLANVDVRCTRAEELPGDGSRETYGVVLARAVAALPTLVEYAGPLLAEGGELLAWKGRRDAGEELAGTKAAAQVGLEPVSVHPVAPYAGSRNRHLHLYRKVRPCPAKFPRRPGMAHRKPLA